MANKRRCVIEECLRKDIAQTYENLKPRVSKQFTNIMTKIVPKLTNDARFSGCFRRRQRTSKNYQKTNRSLVCNKTMSPG